MAYYFENSYKGYLRAASLVAKREPRRAMACYACAASLNVAIVGSIVKEVQLLRDRALYGQILTRKERRTTSMPAIYEMLWPKEFDDALAGVLWRAPLFEGEFIGPTFVIAPPRLSWLYPGCVAGSGVGTAGITRFGITHLITMAATPYEKNIYEHDSLEENIWIPIPRDGVPTFEEMDNIYERVKAGGTWLIQCDDGVGPTSAVLACLIGMFGDGTPGDEAQADVNTDWSLPQLDAFAAIALLRGARPRSFRSTAQSEFVALWIARRWDLPCTPTPPRIPEPSAPLSIEGDAAAARNARMLFLVGAPGSGKSWLAAAIAKRRDPKLTVIIDDDELNNTSFMFRISQHLAPGNLVIVDWCNLERRLREVGIRGAGVACAAVYFDCTPGLRAQRLLDDLKHPLLVGRRMRRNMVPGMKTEPPAMDEGWSALLCVRSFAAAREAVHHLAPIGAAAELPSAPHLLVDGDRGANSGEEGTDGGRERSTTPSDDLLPVGGNFTLEEKLDGTALTISLDWKGVPRAEHAGRPVCERDHVQFRMLSTWLSAKQTALRKLLGTDTQFLERFVLYGEWLAARHTVQYTALPSPFIAFDLYDRIEARFASRRALASALKGTGIVQAPLIAETHRVSRQRICDTLARAGALSDDSPEGVYIRIEDARRLHTISRRQVVRPDYVPITEAWKKAPVVPNGIKWSSSNDEPQ